MLAAGSLLNAQIPGWLWASSAGGRLDDYSWDLATDAGGNRYVTGYFTGIADFGAVSLAGNDGYNFFAAKYDAAGNICWAKPGISSYSEGKGIAADSTGCCYVAGSFLYSLDLGDLTLTSQGGADIFVGKLDTDGNWLWVVNAGSGGYDYSGKGIALDGAGNVCVTGLFEGTATFGANILVSSGEADIFTAKLDPDGNWLWARRAGGPTYWDMGQDLATDDSGNIYLTGHFIGSADFGPTTLTATGLRDIFVAKLDPDGNWLWATKAGGIDDDWAGGIAVAADGSQYITGSFRRTAQFGAESLFSGNNNYDDIYAAKLDSAGNWLWARRAGGSSYHDYGHGIAVSANGGCQVTGLFSNTADFGDFFLYSRGSGDIFASELDSVGNWLWAKRAGGEGWDSGFAIAAVPSGEICVTGIIAEEAAFKPFVLTSLGDQDIFIAEMAPGVDNDDELAPEAVSYSCLFPARPNPCFRSETLRIKAQISAGEEGDLGLFNLRGQRLAQHNLGPGLHDIDFDTGDLASGIYLFRLSTRSSNEIRKVFIIK